MYKKKGRQTRPGANSKIVSFRLNSATVLTWKQVGRSIQHVFFSYHFLFLSFLDNTTTKMNVLVLRVYPLRNDEEIQWQGEEKRGKVSNVFL